MEPTVSAAPADVTGLVLAGGASRRFGSDKAVSETGGRRMVDPVFAALAAVTAEVIVSRRDAGQADLRLPGRVVYDRLPGCGPLAGIEAALHACRTPWLLVVACDLPAVTAGSLRRLLAERAAGVPAVVAVDAAGRRQPLCACYHARVLPDVTARLEAGALRMRDFVDGLAGVRTVLLPGAELRNVNRPADLP